MGEEIPCLVVRAHMIEAEPVKSFHVIGRAGSLVESFPGASLMVAEARSFLLFPREGIKGYGPVVFHAQIMGCGANSYKRAVRTRF